ncbi:MAG: hypothetical protein O7F76_06255 [Planctomycetota bacterium]|nr:hypothetical protein [Planctomycetota bacterium]
MRRATTFILAGLFCPGPLIADQGSIRDPSPASDTVRVFRDALANFDAAVAVRNHADPAAQRRYRQAADGFQALVEAGIENGRLYYNLANAQLRLGETGHAVVNYRRALRLMPGDANIRRNLGFARNLCQVQIPPKATSAILEAIFFWHFQTSNAARMRIAVAGYAGFWFLMIAGLLARRRPPGVFWTTCIVGAVTLVLGLSVGWEHLASTHREEGALIVDEVVLRKGNGVNYDPQLDTPLSQGVEFRLLETREDLEGNAWYYIELSDGTDGWLRGDQAGLI